MIAAICAKQNSKKGIMKILFLPVLVATLLMGAGCKEENSAEKAGRELDRAAEKTKEKVKEGAEKTGDAIKDAGNKVKDATK